MDWLVLHTQLGEELRLAQKLGYKFEVLEAILYERGQIFHEYVSELYEMRLTYAKSDPRNLICKLLLNSLYGKFGMDPHLMEWTLMATTAVPYLKKVPADIIELGIKALVGTEAIKNQDVSPPNEEKAMAALAKMNNISLDELKSRLNDSTRLKKELENLMKPGKYLQISLPISAAVTAYARCNIYKYKEAILNSGGTLYYSDTDSVFSSMPLSDSLIGPELGKMKLEYTAARAIFLAPKVYAAQFSDGSTKLKIKGSKDNSQVSFAELENLLYKESNLKLNQEKWYRSFAKSTINIRETLYTLKVTENKRALVYTNNKFVYTKPFVLDR